MNLTNQFQNIAACNYYHPDSPLFASKPSNSLFILHINIRSINKNFPSFYDFIQSFPNHPDIICISETWITHQPITNVSLPGYEFIYYPTKKRAGGVAMYVSTIYQFEITDIFNIDCDDCENLWIKLSHVRTNAKNIVGVVYRHPTPKHKNFISALNESIMKITKTNQTFYLCGDFNVNISPESSNPSANDFLNVILGNSVFPTLTIPTRITENSKTIIDNIITNDSNIILPGIIQTDISDHFVIFSLTMNFNKPLKNNIKIYRRDKSKFNSEEFCCQLESNLQAFNLQIYSATRDNFNQLFAEFVALIENTIEIHAPLKKLSRKQQKLQSKPWITKGILISVRHKRKLYKSHFLAGTEIQKRFYKKYLNTLTKVKTASKKIYYRQEFGRNLNNPRKTWELIRSALPTNQSRTNKSKIDLLKIDGQDINESFSIAEKLNEHFVSVGKNLADKIPTNDNNSFSKYLNQKVASSMFLQPPRHSEVFNIIHSLRLRKSSGHDNIDSYFIRIACNVLTPYLTYLFHLSFEFNIFPDCLKTAKIIPIFKAGPKTDINNY